MVHEQVWTSDQPHNMADFAPYNHYCGSLYGTVSFGYEGSIAYELIDGSVYTTSTERIAELQEEYPFELSEIFKSVKFNLF